MLEIITTNYTDSIDDTPIHKVFKNYGKCYHLENIHKKCIIYKTDCKNNYLYLFPSLPENKQISEILTQKTWEPPIYTNNDSNVTFAILGTPISIYPKTFDIKANIFDFLNCDFYLKIAINELTIEKARYICSNLQITIKNKKNEENKENKENEENIFSKTITIPKKEINAFDLDLNINSIWEKSFLTHFMKKEEYTHLTHLEIECQIKEINPEEYNIIKERTNVLYILYCIRETEYSISRLFCEIFRLSFICSNHEKKIINSFKNHKWHISDGGICIKKAISNDFPEKLIQLKSKFNELELDEIVRRICHIIQNQKTRHKIFIDCCEILYDENFSKKTNSKGLISFNNGVYDINLDKLRPGISSDYITLSTKIPYKKFDSASPIMEELTEFLQKIFPVRKIMNYFIRFLSSCLEGGNKDKIFSIWSGLGDNGKSVLVNLISLAFGEYSVKLPTSLISGKRSQSASATPELAMIEGALISFLQEPDETDKMNLGIVKELTGNDSIYIRGIYEKGRNVKISSKFILIANRIPQLGIDNAAWNRIRVLPFLSTFIDNPEKKEDKGYFFKKNINFSQNLPYLAPALMYLLTEEHKKYKLYGLEEPEEIKKYTQELKTINDPLEQFINSNIDIDSKSSENVKELYENYKTWFKNMFPTSKVLDISIFSRELKKKTFIINSLDQVLGIRLIN